MGRISAPTFLVGVSILVGVVEGVGDAKCCFIYAPTPFIFNRLEDVFVDWSEKASHSGWPFNNTHQCMSQMICPLYRHTDLGCVLHNVFLILPTWLLPTRLSHTSAPLGYKWSCPVPTSIENLAHSLCSSIKSVLVVGIGNLSPKPRFLLICFGEGVRACFYPWLYQAAILFQCPLAEGGKTPPSLLMG